MSLEKIQQALIQQLATSFPTWVADSQIAWENVAFTPPAGKPWLAFHFMPIDENIATLGPTGTGTDRIDGMVQIDVNYPEGTGEGSSRATINTLRDAYKPGILSYSSQPVTVTSRTRTNGLVTNGFFKIPFTIRWHAHLIR